jgi:hypothetical protein
MMKYTPWVRSDSAPTTSAYAAAASTLAGSSHSSDAASLCGDSSTAAYAPMPKNAAWPKHTSPVAPTSSSRLNANTA